MEQKYRTLLDQHQDRVYGLAVYLLRDRAEAQDVVQECFEQLWRQIAQIDMDRATGWLLQVARNACVDRLRRRRDTEEVQDFHLQELDGPEHSLRQQQLQHAISHALGEMEEPYRSLLVLRDMQQNSYREVAEILDLSMTQVKVYLHRARRRMRSQLEAMAGESKR